MLLRGVRLADRTSGESFSFEPETTLSPLTFLSTDGNATFRSDDTRRVPFKADPLLDGVRLVERGFAMIPSPIAAFGVEATPLAFSGEAPNGRACRRSCTT